MPENLFSSEVREIKALEQQLHQLTTDRTEKATKAEQLAREVFKMRERRDFLENIISDASTLLLENKLTVDDYTAHKQELSTLYQAIDSTDEIFNIYERATTDSYVKKFAELQNKINDKRTRLLNQYASKLSFDLVNQCEVQLRELLATLPGGGQSRAFDLGNSLIFALDHDPGGNLKRIDSNQPKEIVNSIFKRIGLE